MQMSRTRVRWDRFELRGWTYPFNELRDGATFARLEADTDDTQEWTLRSGHTVEIRPGDIDTIAPQIGMPIPGKRRVVAEVVTPPPAAPPELPPPAAVIEEGEPLPDVLAPILDNIVTNKLAEPTLLARLVVNPNAEAKREALKARWLELTHKVHAPKVFGLTDAELREHQQLEAYRGLFA